MTIFHYALMTTSSPFAQGLRVRHGLWPALYLVLVAVEAPQVPEAQGLQGQHGRGRVV